MSFDPSALTVKEAVKQLAGLSDDALSEVYDAELDGKGRTSLLGEVTSLRDALREGAQKRKGGGIRKIRMSRRRS